MRSILRIWLKTLILAVAISALAAWWWAEVRRPLARPLVIHRLDIVRVAAKRVLPGRPLAGDRQVGADGTLSLGDYGDIYVEGLTVAEAANRIAVQILSYVGPVPGRRPRPSDMGVTVSIGP